MNMQEEIPNNIGNIGTYQLNLGYFLQFNLSEKAISTKSLISMNIELEITNVEWE